MFSEPERCLVEKWQEARLLEEAMKSIRSKYAEIIDVVLEEVRKNHPDLNAKKDYFPKNGSYGMVAIGKAKWPKGSYNWPSGYFIDCLNLKNLTSPDAESPIKYVYIYHPNPKDIEKRLGKAAERILGKEELRRWEPFVENTGAGISCSLEPREELLGMLIGDDASAFIDCMAAHFESMARFTSAFDEILSLSESTRK